VGAGNPAPQDKRHFEDGQFPFYRTSDVGQIRFGEISTSADLLNAQGAKGLRLVPAGAVLMPKSGASTFLNHRVITCADGYVSSHLATVTARKGIAEPRFLLYALSQVKAQDLLAANSYPSLNLSLISGITVPLPPLEEQQRIVAVLDEAFEGLARARAHAEANLQNARDLFEGQLSAIFKRIDTGQKKALGEVCDFVRGPFGGSLKKAIFKPSGYAVYEQQHAIRDQFDDFRYFIDDTKFSEMQRFRVEPGDLIMSCSGTMGKVAIVPEGALDGIINQALLKLRPSEDLRADFLKRWMQSDDFQDQLSANTMGVAIKNVASVKTLKNLLATVPSLEEQDDIVSKSEEAEQQFSAITRSYEAKLEDLDDLRQSLLRRAFAGELT
jgi:type I restriction enzyme, S subunit